jgi:hypothetical protein
MQGLLQELLLVQAQGLPAGLPHQSQNVVGLAN